MSEVATRFGISDVGLAKACRRANIPLPARGYWAKTQAGKLIQSPRYRRPRLAFKEELGFGADYPHGLQKSPSRSQPWRRDMATLSDE